MPAWLLKLLGINWRTTLAALSSMGAIGAAIIAAFKVKDFSAIFDHLPLFFTALGVVLANLGLLFAKDKNVTGVGTQAKALAGAGALVNVEGDVVGVQPSKP